MATFIEYLNPADWSLHLVNVNNDAAGEDWIKVPEGAEIACDWCNDCDFYKLDGSLIYTFEQGNWELCEFNKEYFFENARNIHWSRYTQPEELPFIDDEPATAFDTQVGGNHYRDLKIQPMQYALENKLDYAQANVVKYVTRHASKNGKEDLLKAIHNIELMIDYYYGDNK